MKTVFVLGAGFSKSFAPSMPLLDDFKQKIIDVIINSYDYPALSQLADKYKAAMNFKKEAEWQAMKTILLLNKRIE